MSSSLRDIFRRRRASQPMDERLPDGRSVDELIAAQGDIAGKPMVPTRNVPQQTPQPQVLTPTNQAAITRPRRTYNTSLSPEDEQKFTQWKQQFAPDDTGEDYDLRGAYQAGLKPDATSGHWPDTFKKPNHPTFSNQSQYATGADAAGAGMWNGDQFMPPQRSLKTILQQRAAQAPLGSIPDTATTTTARPEDLLRNDSPTATRDRRTQPRDYIADDQAYLRDLEHHKGPFWKRLAAASIRGGQAATGQEVSPILTSRERDIADTTSRLGRDITTARTQQAIEQGQMVPFQLPDGSWTQVPLKQVGTLGSRQQNQQQTLSVRKQQMDSHNKRWDTMGQHEAAQDAQRLYNSGAADDNEDLRDEIAKRMRLPVGTKLPPHTQGQIRVDDQGNFILINPKVGTSAPVTAPNSTTPTGSMTNTLEQGRERRFNTSQQGLDRRATAARVSRETKTAAPDKTAQRRAAQLTGTIEAARKKLEAFDSRNLGVRTPDIERRRKAIADEAAPAITELSNLNAGYEAGMGTGGYPYYKQKEGASDLNQPIIGTPTSGQYAGRRISTAKLPEFAKRHGMTVEQARQYLTDEKAIIY